MAVDAIETRQTHISAVFLAGSHVYKIKKPVALGFVDFSTLERRHHFCQEEVRLNRRLAADVYLDVVPVVRQGEKIRVEGQGEVVEWAVKMHRLPDEATLGQMLERGAAGSQAIVELARRIAAFHAAADSGPAISACGRFEIVSANARDNLVQSAARVGIDLHQAVFDRLRQRVEESLARHRELIEVRAQRDVPRDTHGDLRLDHVYLLGDAGAMPRIVIIDCIEFNPQLRYADPVADIAFLLMDLESRGYADLARLLADEYFRATGDDEGRTLLGFYTSYRAAVRGKVEGMKATESEVPTPQRAAAAQAARAYWMLALAELEPPEGRPCLVLVGGLPGVGKSTLAAELARRANFQVIRSDVVRKELAGEGASRSDPRIFGKGIYSPQWNNRTYAECLRRAQAMMFEGQRVIVDASFREDSRRVEFLKAAADRGVRALFLECQANSDAVRARLAGRKGDASDADWAIYRAAAETWEPAGPAVQGHRRLIDTGVGIEQSVTSVTGILSRAGLHSSSEALVD